MLAIAATGLTSSAAVAVGDRVLAAERHDSPHGQAEALLPLVDVAMRRAALPPVAIDTVAVIVGPGSFTGIRVGLAAARGIALAAGARLIGVSGFAAVAAAVAPVGGAYGGHLLVALDSRRADLYVQLFMIGSGAALAAPRAVPPDCLGSLIDDLAAGTALLVAGDAASTAAAVLAGRCDIVADSAPDALGVAAAALRQIQSGAATEPARPMYLRPPDVTLPKSRERPALRAP